MKTKTWFRLALTASLAVGIFATGCANNTETKIADESSEKAPAPAVTEASEATQKVPPIMPQYSPGIQEVVSLAQASVEESVILAYIEGSPVAYAPTADEIVYLNDIGISSNVISALMRRGQQLRAEGAGSESPETMAPSIAGLESPNVPLPPGIVATNDPLAVASAPPAVTNYVTLAQPPAPAYTPSQQPVTINSFYDSLAPYGTWMQVPDYGWVWQPSVETVNPDWRPYSDGGHWVYSDAGWYWMSDYSWGWAPFHYGRWQNNPQYGWLWVPDTVWGPSWVCWRRTPLYCGWAPLPPSAVYEYGRGFTYYGVTVGSDCDFGLGVGAFGFVQYQYFCASNLRGHWVGGPQGEHLYRNSEVCNRYFLGPNRHIINEGVDRDKVAQFSRTELRRVSIRELPPGTGRIIKPDRIEKDGSSLVIYKPQLQNNVPLRPGARGRPSSVSAHGRQEPGQASPTIDPLNFREASLRAAASRPAPPLDERLDMPVRSTPRAANGETPAARSTRASANRNLNEREFLSGGSPLYPLAPASSPAETRARFSVNRPGERSTTGMSLSGRGQTPNAAAGARMELENPATSASAYSRRFSVSNSRGTPSTEGRNDTYTPAYNRSINAGPAPGSSSGFAGGEQYRQEPARGYNPAARSYTPQAPASYQVQRSEPVYSRPASYSPANNYRSSPSPAPSMPAPSRPSFSSDSGSSRSAPSAPSVSFQSSGSSRGEPVNAPASTPGSDPRRNGK